MEKEKERRIYCGLLQRRICVVPTLRGCICMLIVVIVCLATTARSLFGFLGVSHLYPEGILVVEGWAPDYVLAQGIEEFQRHPYDGLFVTGGPIDKGAPFSEQGTYAEFGAATIRRINSQLRMVHAVPAPLVRQDRTYVSAVALKQWTDTHGPVAKTVNVVTLGAHARRTRLLYEKAFGRGAKIGILAVDDLTFDSHRWWASSPGFRTVMSELLGYFYVRLFFWPRAG